MEGEEVSLKGRPPVLKRLESEQVAEREAGCSIISHLVGNDDDRVHNAEVLVGFGAIELIAGLLGDQDQDLRYVAAGTLRNFCVLGDRFVDEVVRRGGAAAAAAVMGSPLMLVPYTPGGDGTVTEVVAGGDGEEGEGGDGPLGDPVVQVLLLGEVLANASDQAAQLFSARTLELCAIFLGEDLSRAEAAGALLSIVTEDNEAAGSAMRASGAASSVAKALIGSPSPLIKAQAGSILANLRSRAETAEFVKAAGPTLLELAKYPTPGPAEVIELWDQPGWSQWERAMEGKLVSIAVLSRLVQELISGGDDDDDDDDPEDEDGGEDGDGAGIRRELFALAERLVAEADIPGWLTTTVLTMDLSGVGRAAERTPEASGALRLFEDVFDVAAGLLCNALPVWSLSGLASPLDVWAAAQNAIVAAASSAAAGATGPSPSFVRMENLTALAGALLHRLLLEPERGHSVPALPLDPRALAAVAATGTPASLSLLGLVGKYTDASGCFNEQAHKEIGTILLAALAGPTRQAASAAADAIMDAFAEPACNGVFAALGIRQAIKSYLDSLPPKKRSRGIVARNLARFLEYKSEQKA